MKNARKILLADSCCNMARVAALEEHGYEVVTAQSGKEAYGLMMSHCPDLLAIKAGDSNIDAGALLTAIREWSDTPALMICTCIDEYDSVQHAQADFIVEPFSAEELIGRVRLVLKYHMQCSISAPLNKIQIGELVVDHDRCRVLVDGRDAQLTNSEYRIVELLAMGRDSVITYDDLSRQLWGPNFIGTNQALRVNMANIRRKIEEDTSLPRYFHTVTGVGYMLSDGK